MSSQPESVFKFLPLGAIVQDFRVGGLNIVQNFPSAELYEKYNDPYFGETIGRVANRICGAQINNLNGKSYKLAANNGPNSLHGGNVGWGKRIFDGPFSHTWQASDRNARHATLYKYTSPDGEEGYPGTVQLKIYYTPFTEKQGESTVEVLEIEYEAELVGHEDIEETAIGLTNHRLLYLCILYNSTKLMTIVTSTSTAAHRLKALKSRSQQTCTNPWTIPAYRLVLLSHTLASKPMKCSLLEQRNPTLITASSKTISPKAFQLIHVLCQCKNLLLFTIQ
jgi:galactose mutarotase-like enzyme